MFAREEERADGLREQGEDVGRSVVKGGIAATCPLILGPIDHERWGGEGDIRIGGLKLPEPCCWVVAVGGEVLLGLAGAAEGSNGRSCFPIFPSPRPAPIRLHHILNGTQWGWFGRASSQLGGNTHWHALDSVGNVIGERWVEGEGL